MTTYNTGNPVPSGNAYDRFDNSQTFDEVVNSVLPTAETRLGKQIKTLSGQEQDFNQFLINSGFEPNHLTYVVGTPLQVDRPTQLIDYNGSVYRVKMPATFPVNLTGVWASDSSLLVDVGDASLRQLLASTAGAGAVGTSAGVTVEQALDDLTSTITTLEGPSTLTVVPPFSYSGNRSYTPIMPEGTALPQQTFVAPVHIDMAHWDNPTPPALGPIWKFGSPGLTSGPFWSQDSYILKNATIVDGPPQIATWEAWTGDMLVVENVRVVNCGAPGEWAFVGKGQNWWPIFRGNTWADVENKHGNFFKFIDDDAIGPGGADMRYTGNSRCVISENRVKSLGGEVGGVGFYTSAVGTSYTDNACEGMLIGIQLGYPSTLTTIRKYYTELPFGNSASILIGDGTPAPNNLISDVVIDGAYANMHLFDSNAFIAIANAEVVIDRLTLDDISISNVSANPTPLVSLNDLNGQSISVGSIRANDVPVIPLTTSHVRIVDMYNAEIKALNGDFSYISVPTVTVPANTWTPLAGNWFQRSSAGSSFERATTGASRQARRQSRYVGYSYFSAGSNALCYQLPRANQYEGGLVTCQFLMQASSTIAMQVVVRIYNPDGSRLTLRTKDITVVNSMREFTVSFFDNLYANSDDSVIAVEIYNNATGAVNVTTTGMRFNLGGFGLCGRSDTLTAAETQAGVTGRTWITP